jgi:exosome complex RNA-binding protein Rrp42 (RNase PH superfamily)
MAFNEEGNICAIQKGGAGHFTQKQILEGMKLAREKAAELRKQMKW